MSKQLVISEEKKFAVLMDNKEQAIEYFLDNPDFCIGDIYSVRVENILAGINAVFVNMGHGDRMGFLHAHDIEGSQPLREKIFPKQKLLVQVVKEPTLNKGPRVSTKINLTGRFFVLTLEHENIIMSRRIGNADERARLKAIATLLKPPGFGMVIRTEAEGATEDELEGDFKELFLERWKEIIDKFEGQRRSGLLVRDRKNLLYKVLRDVFHEGVDTIATDCPGSAETIKYYTDLWGKGRKINIDIVPTTKELFTKYNVIKELEKTLSEKVELPSGGHILIQQTEALTAIDVNSGRFTSSNNPEDTIIQTNIEAAQELAKQLRLRNIGGVIVIDFIDMNKKSQRIRVLEKLEKALEQDPSRPQIGRLSDLGLVELTRHRQERNIKEALGQKCSHCNGKGITFEVIENLLQNESEIKEKKEELPVKENKQNNYNSQEKIHKAKEHKNNKPEEEKKDLTEDELVKQLLSEHEAEKKQNKTEQKDRKKGKYSKNTKQRPESKEINSKEDKDNQEQTPAPEKIEKKAEEVKSSLPSPKATETTQEKKEIKKEIKGVSINEYKTDIDNLTSNKNMPGVFSI